MSIRNGFLLASVLLCALPIAAGEPSAPTCSRAATGAISAGEPIGGSSTEPLAVDQRLLVDPSALAAGPIEVHYRAGSDLYLVESVDLASADLPQTGGREEASSRAQGLDPVAEGPRVVELLAMRPDAVRRLHQMAEAGTEIEIDLFAGGSWVETLSYRELGERSARLRGLGAVPLVLGSTVAGPGALLEPLPRPQSANGCGYCDSTVPCDAVGPYDPGKGDCVTCWETGDCDPGPCACESTLHEYWGSWFVVSAVAVGPYACVDWSFGPDERALRYSVTYRRNRIRLSQVCPQCPLCTGCYNQEQVISYQQQQILCYANLHQSCQVFDPVIGPWELCP